MSRRLVPSVVLSAAAAVVLTAAPASAAPAVSDLTPATAVPAPTVVADPFYDAPAATGEPGTLLRSRPAAVPLAGVLPFTAQTVLYTSTSATGEPQVVSGTVFTPTLSPQAGTVLTIAPGTQGLGPQCAPSKQFVAGTEYELGSVAAGLAQGWTVAVTDYDGYVGGGSPTYTTGPSMAHAVLDLARAASAVPGARSTDDAPVLLQGYSQGGGGAAWAASLAPQYAPELDVEAAAVGGVPADLGALARSLDGGPAAYFGLLGVIGLDAAYPDAVRLDERLNARGQQVVAQLRTECVGGAGTLGTAFTSVADYTADGATLEQLLAEPDIAAVVAENDLATRPAPTVPVYQSHAAADEIVALGQAQDLHETWCAAGVTTRLDLLPAEHVTGQVESLPGFAAWLGAVSRGLPVVPSC